MFDYKKYIKKLTVQKKIFHTEKVYRNSRGEEISKEQIDLYIENQNNQNSEKFISPYHPY